MQRTEANDFPEVEASRREGAIGDEHGGTPGSNLLGPMIKGKDHGSLNRFHRR